MNKVYQEITDQIIQQLHNGTVPWKQPWFGSCGAVSYATGKPYSLLNQMILGGESAEFITWHQIQMLKGRIHKGSKGRKVYFWSTFDKAEETEDGERTIKKIPYLRTYTVFRVSDCDGVTQRWQPQINNTTISPIKQAEDLANKYLQREQIELRHTNPNQAYYSISGDYINLPSINNFKSAEEYAAVLYHECTHSSGHPKRLGRFQVNDHSAPFGSEVYSKEELIAEMGSAFILRRIGIDTTTTQQQNAAYIKSWISALKNDISMVAIAAGRAEKAVRYIFGEDPNE